MTRLQIPWLNLEIESCLLGHKPLSISLSLMRPWRQHHIFFFLDPVSPSIQIMDWKKRVRLRVWKVKKISDVASWGSHSLGSWHYSILSMTSRLIQLFFLFVGSIVSHRKYNAAPKEYDFLSNASSYTKNESCYDLLSSGSRSWDLNKEPPVRPHDSFLGSYSIGNGIL